METHLQGEGAAKKAVKGTSVLVPICCTNLFLAPKRLAHLLLLPPWPQGSLELHLPGYPFTFWNSLSALRFHFYRPWGALPGPKVSTSCFFLHAHSLLIKSFFKWISFRLWCCYMSSTLGQELCKHLFLCPQTLAQQLGTQRSSSWH